MKHTALVKQVADLLATETATHPEFFFELAKELHDRGFELEAHQGGIRGTLIMIVMRLKEDK